jgi:2-phospho-L-lactate guanylyltransferase
MSEAVQRRVLIPLKRLAGAKSRLSALLTPAERRDLVLEMLAHVVAAVRESAAAPPISLVSNEPTAGQLAQQLGIELIEDQCGELNAALTDARAISAALGTEQLLILAADLPQVSAADVEQLFGGLAEADVVIGPDAAGLGTNALALQLPQGLALALCYGAASAGPHAQAAAAAGLRVGWYRSAALGLDVDDAAALERLRAAGQNGGGILADGATPDTEGGRHGDDRAVGGA